MASALYTTEILRLATSIPNLGRLDSPQGSAERRSPVCGSKISVDVDVDAEGRVVRFAQMVSACALGQASAAILGDKVVGQTAAQLEAASRALAAWLDDAGPLPEGWDALTVFLPARSHTARHGAIRLPLETAAEAVAQAAHHA